MTAAAAPGGRKALSARLRQRHPALFKLARGAYVSLQNIRNGLRYHARVGGHRAAAEDAMAALARGRGPSVVGRVLVDGMFDNPNMWLRYSVLRAALGLASAEEVGVTGPYVPGRCRRSFHRLGIRRVVGFDSMLAAPGTARRQARDLIAGTRRAEDVLGWRLPGGYPAAVLYDALLKRQTAAQVDVADPLLEEAVAEAIACMTAAERLLDHVRPDLVVLTHVCNFRDSALAWFALRRGIPCIGVFGSLSSIRFWRLSRAEDWCNLVSRPSGTDIDALPAAKAEALAALGGDYLGCRLAGETRDIGAVYAYSRRVENAQRADLERLFHWDPAKPVVSVYAPTWFDFPHGGGMTQFRDFLDWITVTVRGAEQATHCNWLFKAHPCDDWYGGITLSDLLPAELPPHIRLVPREWNGAAVMAMTDALVTFQGTAGIEYAANGKPVLVAERGWYHDCGFTVVPRDRADYEALLGRDWWAGVDPARASHRARVFAGWYFCVPDWQDGFLLGDDPEQERLYPGIPALLADHPRALEREIATIRDWYHSGEHLYHVYKMRIAEGYSLSNVRR